MNNEQLLLKREKQSSSIVKSVIFHFGESLRKFSMLIETMQCVIILIYISILGLGFFAHAQRIDAGIQVLLWGVVWPLISLSALVFGRFWCGLFCPDGTLTQWISQYGLKRPIPQWIRWRGWSYILFLLTFVFVQIFALYHEVYLSCLSLAIPSVLALICGLVYGHNRRIWCMYFCPIKALLELFSINSLLHFKVDAEKWTVANSIEKAPHCAPLINIKKMKTMAYCHACANCSNYRQAVCLSARSPLYELKRVHQTPINGQRLFFIWFASGIVTVALSRRNSLIVSSLYSGILTETSYVRELLFVLVAGLLISCVFKLLLTITQKISGLKEEPMACVFPVVSWGIMVGFFRDSALLLSQQGIDTFWCVWLERAIMLMATTFSFILIIHFFLKHKSVRSIAILGAPILMVLFIDSIWLF